MRHKTMKSQTIAIIAVLCFSGISFAQERMEGEVFNVNAQHRIAFTDISSDSLKKGDIVEIFNNGNFVTYLEVYETSDIMSSLGFVQSKRLKTNESDFDRISIGSTVLKVKQGGAQEDLDALISRINTIEKQSAELKGTLQEKNKLLENLQKEGQSCKQESEDLKKRTSLLKDRLNYLAEIIDKKIYYYESE